MAEKSGKKKTKKATKADTGVLGTLSATRPNRLGGDRRGATRAASSAAATKSSGAKASSPPAAASAAKTAAATRPKAATKRKTTAKPKVRTTADTQPRPPSAPPAGWQTPDEDGRKSGPPSGSELVTTAVQAAGELAQLGIAMGGQLLKRAAGRIPRP